MRDSDRILGLLASKSRRAEDGRDGVTEYLVLTRYDGKRVGHGHMLAVEDVLEILNVGLLGVIPESHAVLQSSNAGVPVILDEKSDAGQAYQDVVARYLGEDRPMRFVNTAKRGLFARLFGGA